MPKSDVRKLEIENTKSWLDAGSKAFLILYGIGYFIESYYDSRYGIGYINPLRSKVGFTGIAFGLQVVAAILCFKMEEVVNNSSLWAALCRQGSGWGRHLLKCPYYVTWIGECAVIAFILIFVFVTGIPYTLSKVLHALMAFLATHHSAVASGALADQPAATPTRNYSFLYGLPAAVAFAMMSIGGTLAAFTSVSRRLCATLASIGGLFLFAFTASMGTELYPGLFLAMIFFVAFIRLGFGLIQSDLNSMTNKRKAFLFLVALLVPILYAQSIYDRVSPQWGGAGAAEVRIQYERDVEPFKNPDSVRLLEETDEGFYLVPADPGDWQAVYVPRKDVREVQYTARNR